MCRQESLVSAAMAQTPITVTAEKRPGGKERFPTSSLCGVLLHSSMSLTVGDTATLSARVIANGHDLQLARPARKSACTGTTFHEEVDGGGVEVDRPGNRRHRDGYRGRGRHGHDHGDYVDIGRHWPFTLSTTVTVTEPPTPGNRT